MWVFHSGDRCDLASTFYKCDLRNCDLFVLGWARVRRERRGSISSELLMCSGGAHSILLLPLVARCIETIEVCIWHMFIFMSVVTVCVLHDLQFVNAGRDARGDHMEEVYSRAGLMTA